MKRYIYLFIFLSIILFDGCKSKKQASTEVKRDVVTIISAAPDTVKVIDSDRKIVISNVKPKVLTEKDLYEQAFKELRDMLDGRIKPNFERAVFVSENPYYNGAFKYEYFQNCITTYANFITRMIDANDRSDTMNFDAKVNEYGKFAIKDLRYLPKQKKELYRKALSNWAVFKFVTDTVNINLIKDSSINVFYHNPYSYATNDPFGMKDWSNSQVLHLISAKNQSGNCFALTALYKILSDRLRADAKICTAPQHIYIQHQDQKGQFYNVELATAGHPADGIIQTLTYTPSDAIMSGIALRHYTTKQSIGLCLVNLAKSYEHKFKTKSDNFMLRCADLALRHDSLNLNAILLKAQVLDAQVVNYATSNRITSIEKLKSDSVIGRIALSLEKHLLRLASLGYRQMPIDMQEMIMNPMQYDPKKWNHKTRNPRPFTTIKVQDPKDEEYWTLTKGIFQEVFEPRTVENYGHFTVNTSLRKLIKIDTTTQKGFVIDPVAFAYDFGARMYDARVGRFITVDPATAQYTSLSPYHFVANSPIMLVEIDGRVFDLSHLSAAERTKYDAVIKTLSSSKLFAYYYKQLESSTNVYTIKTGQVGKEGGGSYDSRTGTVRFIDMGAYTVAQELFHAYQDEGGFYPNPDWRYSRSHIETEGDVMTQYVTLEAGALTPAFGDWSNEIMSFDPTADFVTSANYKNLFNKATDMRIDYYKKQAAEAGRNDAPGYTLPNSNEAPLAIIKVVKEAAATEDKLQGPRLPNGDYYEN